MKNIMPTNYLALFAVAFALCLGCNSNSPKEEKNSEVRQEIIQSKSELTLAYIDSLIQLPLAQYNQEGVVLVNQFFKDSLPIRVYDGIDQVADTNILVSIPKPSDSIRYIAVSLPQSLTDSLTIANFIKRFGKLREVPKPIAPPKLPLPKYIDLSEKAYLKLFFNDRNPIDSAPIRSVEIYKHQ